MNRKTTIGGVVAAVGIAMVAAGKILGFEYSSEQTELIVQGVGYLLQLIGVVRVGTGARDA